MALWRGSERARAEAVASDERAQAEARRSEASKLVVLGESELATYPTGALAYAIASLETADTEPARLLALRVLQQAPVARLAPVGKGEAQGAWALDLDFSPDGEWVATGGFTKSEVLNRDGERRLILGEYPSAGQASLSVRFTPDSRVLVANLLGEVRAWSIPEGREVSRRRLADGSSAILMGADSFVTRTKVGERAVFWRWPLDGGEPRVLGTLDRRVSSWSLAGDQLAYSRGRAVYVRSLEDWRQPPRLVAEHTSDVWDLGLSPDAELLAATDRSAEMRVWTTRGSSAVPLRVLDARGRKGVSFDRKGRWLLAGGSLGGQPSMRLWDRQSMPGAEPLVLQRRDQRVVNWFAFEGRSEWLASAHANDLAFWWLGDSRCHVVRVGALVSGLAFTPRGDGLVTASSDGTVRLWPLHVGAEVEATVLLRAGLGAWPSLVLDPMGETAAVGGSRGQVHLIPLDGRPGRSLRGFSERADIGGGLAFSSDGRLLAVVPMIGPPEEKVIRIWNLESGETRVLGPIPGAGEHFTGGVGSESGPPVFVDRDRRILLTAQGVGTVSADLADGTLSTLSAHPRLGGFFNHAGTGGFGHTMAGGAIPEHGNSHAVLFRVGGTEPEPLAWPTRGDVVRAAFDASDRLLAIGGSEGTVRVALAEGGEPHALFGHESQAMSVAFSPDGQWLASGSADGTLRVCPVPDVTATPFHKLPLEELLAKLRTHTNLRALPDPSSLTGYRLEPGPFPGWAHPPEPWYTPASPSTPR